MSILSLDNLESFNSLSPLEQQELLSTVEPSQLEKVLGNLRKLELYSQKPESKYIRMPPWPKQELFLGLDCLEALYRGAAGGGKSDALLRGALQYVHVPGYSALILRTDYQRLKLSGGLIPRSHEWLAGKGPEWNGTDSRWTFPSGATIQFGYLANSTDKYRYGSSEYQYIAFDELTEFNLEDYLFLFSRLRKKINIPVPYRIRAASNPGGKSHDAVKSRFVTKEAEHDLATNDLKGVYYTDGRAFVPAKVVDNPAIDKAEYSKNLMHLGPVDRERLMNGDWSIMPTGLIKSHWLRYFKLRHQIVELLVSKPSSEGVIHTNEVFHEYDEREATRFITIDAAGGVEDIEKEHQGKPQSYTAIGTYDHKWVGTNDVLLVRRVKRGKGLSYPDMRDMVREEYRLMRPSRVYVEDKAMGMALYGDLKREMPIECITPTKDKVARAACFLNMMSEGRVYFPSGENGWMPAHLAELLGWTGRKEEVNDQIDIDAYAAIVIGGFMGGSIVSEVDPRVSTDDYAKEHDYGARLHGGGLSTGWV